MNRIAATIAGLSALVALPAMAQFASPVRDVDNPDRQPYQERGSVTISPGIVNGFINFPTPTGKRYVIEFVSVQCTTSSATDTFPQVLLTVTKITSPSSTFSFGTNVVSLEKRGPAFFGGDVHAGSANVKMYSDYSPFTAGGGNGISFNIFHSDASVSASCVGVVTGHTITP